MTDLDFSLLADSDYVRSEYRARRRIDAAAYGLGVAKLEEGPTGELADEAHGLAADLRAYIRAAWHVLEPKATFVSGWHLDAVAEHLMAVTAGEIQDLVINIPPRCTKSLSVVFWMTWEWTSRPWTQWLFSSYVDTLSIRDSLKCRRLIQSGWYRERWGHLFQLAGDQNLKGRFDNNRGGYRIATSVGGASTGEGGNRLVCVPGDQKILTDAGWLPIGRIVEHRLPVRVLSSQGRWQRIAAHEKSTGRPCVRLHLTDGSHLDCTDDHPIWSEIDRGYVAVGNVYSRHGQLRVRQLLGARDTLQGARRAQHDGHFLQSNVLRRIRNREPQSSMGRRGRASRLRMVLPVVHRQAWEGDQDPVLFAGMHGSQQAPSYHSASSDRMRAVRGLVRPASGRAVLRACLREQESRVADARQREPKLQARRVRNALCSWLHEGAAPVDSQTGREPMRGMFPGRWDTASPSHRLGPHEPRSRESRHSLHLVPFATAQQERSQLPLGEVVEVIDVERIPTPDAVYNLRVEPDGDYYASGILVHNCDDPHNPRGAESEIQRAGALEWWDLTWSTRRNDPTKDARVVMMQRLHQQDMTGHILDELGEPFELLLLPMRHDPERRQVTVLGDPDPRTKPGELLSPERFPDETVKALEKTLGPYGTAGQFQQQPIARKGGQFERAWFLTDYDRVPKGSRMIWVRAWDPAGTKDGGAYTCGLLMGLRATDGLVFVKHVVRGQWGAAERNAIILATAEDDATAFTAGNGAGANKRTVLYRFEQEGGSGGKDQAKSFLRLLAGYRVEAEPATGSKFTRADPYAGAAKNGDVHVLPGPWREAYLDEMEAAGPGAKYLDQMDASAMAYNRLMELWDRARKTGMVGVNVAALEDERLEQTSKWKGVS